MCSASWSVGGRRWVPERRWLWYQGPMHSASRTMSQPVRVRQVVSRTRVPGRYRRPAGTITPLGANRKAPAARSRMAANTLGLSGRGRHIHSTRPLGAMSALTSQSERKEYSAMGGNALAIPDVNGAGTASTVAWPSPLTDGVTACPRPSTRAFPAISIRSPAVGRRSYAACPALVSRLAQGAFQGLAHPIENIVQGPYAIDIRARHAGMQVVVEHGRRARAVFVHALHDRLARIVCTTLDRGSVKEPVDEEGLRHVEGDDEI